MPRLSLARRVPVGVVGVIAPFNVPHDPVHPRGRARAGARATRWCSSPTRARRSAAGRVLAEVFAEAGLPDGLLHVLPGGAEVGEALVDRARRCG